MFNVGQTIKIKNLWRFITTRGLLHVLFHNAAFMLLTEAFQARGPVRFLFHIPNECNPSRHWQFEANHSFHGSHCYDESVRWPAIAWLRLRQLIDCLNPTKKTEAQQLSTPFR